jgi:hypothetical protein
VLWHADKTVYQQEVARKIGGLINLLDDKEDEETKADEPSRKMQWFNAFIYIFNK